MIDEVGLAWALANTVDVYLSIVERHDLYIAIGIGETFAAISLLITVIAREKATLPRDLLCALTAWLDCYAGNSDERRLRALIEQIGSQAAEAPPP
jgi:hypothetical protein